MIRGLTQMKHKIKFGGILAAKNIFVFVPDINHIAILLDCKINLTIGVKAKKANIRVEWMKCFH